VARNVEIKARIGDVVALTTRVAAIADGAPVDIRQDDTFFACPRGRLKLRTFSATAGELIFYERADERGPRESSYVVAPTAAPDAVREALSRAYGQMGRVRKTRTLYHVGRTRVHLDRVEGLGEFLELEVVLRDGEPADRGVAEASAIMDRLGITAADLVDGAYVDLLAARPRGRGTADEDRGLT
jgi:adenylate cyclase